MGRWMFALLVILVVVFFVYVKVSSKMPEDLGITEGVLKPCPTTPNCVSSQAPSDDEVHFAEPIIYTGERKATQLLIESSMLNHADMKARLVTSELGYVHFEVKSRLIGFIDDVEFYLPEGDSIVHFRSASRVGYYDFVVNRERVNSIRALVLNGSSPN